MKLFGCFSRAFSGGGGGGTSSRKVKESREIKLIADEFRTAIKILLLGTGESGKTTILKQMKVLHIQGFSDAEKVEQIDVIRNNLHDSICEIVRNVHKLNLEFDTEENEDRAQWVLRLNRDDERFMKEEYIENVKWLLKDNGVKVCFSRANEYQLMDNALYFLERIDDISGSNYFPHTEDILRSRKITTGYYELRFNIKVPRSNYFQEFRMFDVGGQRDQRRKWIMVFDGIEALLFIISCCDFDQTLREDGRTNRLRESFEVFHRVWHNGFLTGAGLICFLNKQDLMEQKIRAGHSLAEYFPEYVDYCQSRSTFLAKDKMQDECEKTRSFIKEQLVEITKEPPRRMSNREFVKRECYFHYTTATDTTNIKKVFNDVHNMILNQLLYKVGLL